jgi:hypothetical protein
MKEELPFEMRRAEPKIRLWHIAIAATFIWARSALVIMSRFGVPHNAAEFGDPFGPASALFSGLAFACVIYAIFLQRYELELQREELKLTRSELAKTSDTALRALILSS